MNKNKHINELENSNFSPNSFVSKTLSQAPKDNTKNKVGCQTVIFKKAPVIVGFYSTVGRKEGEGPCGNEFHYVMQRDLFGEKTYEKAERKMMEHTIFNAIDSANLNPEDIDALICGDLLNQIISSSFAARHFNTTFIGLYGACSTMAESLAIGASMINAEYFHNVACATSSHFSTAERQYRFPLELGNQRTPTSQWTVTGSGCTVLSSTGDGPKITAATFGKVTDFGVKDVNNMGCAMAPAAMHTILAHFRDTKTKPTDYDMILTGDLGRLGSKVLLELLHSEGVDLSPVHKDCGCMIFNEKQKTVQGGSGCGCSASILNSVILKKMRKKELNKVLFVATGALLSTTSSQQGESIPCIAHAVVIENIEEHGENKKVNELDVGKTSNKKANKGK